MYYIRRWYWGLSDARFRHNVTQRWPRGTLLEGRISRSIHITTRPQDVSTYIWQDVTERALHRFPDDPPSG